MERKHISIIVGVLAIIIAVLSFNSYMSVTSAIGTSVFGSSTSSLTISITALIIACGLFAKYFKLIK